VRWTRLFAPLGSAVAILRLGFPRAAPERRRELHAWWSRKLVRIIGVEVRVEGSPPGPGTLLAANHVSWLDVFCVSSVLPTRFTAMRDVRDGRVAGWIGERAATLFVRRARRRDTARINENVHAALAQGDCVGLFPEGTTTMGDELLKFHSSLLEPAAANKLRVHPVAIRYVHLDGSLSRAMAYGDLSFMQSLALMLRQRHVAAHLTFLEPIDAAGLVRREIAMIAQSRIANRLGLPSPGNEPRTPPDLPAGPR
jgi:1-acyl-sn-glycerol-3-phosphate acyltransferase